MKKIVFLGTPSYTLPIVEFFYKRGLLEAIVSKQTKQIGRGLKIQDSDLKKFALKNNIHYIETENINNTEEVFSLNPDCFFVFSFSQFLQEKILTFKPCYNLHLSQLPLLRGAAPVHRAIMSGMTQTGWTIQRMVKKMDAGNIILQNSLNITETDTSNGLIDKLVQDCLLWLDKFLSNDYTELEQNEQLVTFAPLVKKEEGFLNFQQKSAKTLYNEYRAFSSWPGSFLNTKLGIIKVKECSLVKKSIEDYPLKTAEGILYLHTIIPPNKKEMTPEAYFRGLKTCSDLFI